MKRSIYAYSDAESELVIELRDAGLIGQRLTNKFKEVYPNRTHRSILAKVTSLKLKGKIR